MFGARSRGAALAAVVFAVGAALSGCVGSDPKPTSTPKPSSTPLFSSDAKALAAAKESYQRYLDVFNQVANAGWDDLSPFDAVEMGDALAADRKSGQESQSDGLRTIGTATLGKVKIQSHDESGVSIYLCLDVSETRVVDAGGTDRTSPTRTPVLPLLSRFQLEDGALLLNRNDRWSDDSFCS